MKKENNQKNYSSREAWMKQKKENRTKQVWDDIVGWVNLGPDAIKRDNS